MNDHNSWLKPIFNSPPVFVPAFKASVQSGHFVKVFKGGIFLVGRIIVTATELNVINEGDRGPWLDDQVHNNPLAGFVKINWFLPRSLLHFANSESSVASSNVYASDNIELYQTKRYTWLRTSDILELCFVFKYVDLVDGIFCCEGISNAFYARYRYVNEYLLEPICQEQDPFLAFPHLFPMFSLYWSQCWSSEVWDAIVMIQQSLAGLLCRYSQTQGKHPVGRCRVSIASGIMHYIKVWFINRNVF
jgi:hypothetical protein